MSQGRYVVAIPKELVDKLLREEKTKESSNKISKSQLIATFEKALENLFAQFKSENIVEKENYDQLDQFLNKLKVLVNKVINTDMDKSAAEEIWKEFKETIRTEIINKFTK